MRKLIVLLALNLALAGPAHAYRRFGWCEQLYHNIGREKIAREEGERVAEIYDEIFMNNRLHPKGEIRKIAYSLVKQPGSDPQILSEWREMADDDLQATLRALDKMPPREKSEIMSSLSRWKDWSRTVIAEVPQPETVEVGKLRIGKINYEKLLVLQEKLKAEGIETHVSAGPYFEKSHDGVLVVDSASGASQNGILPGKKIFGSKELSKYLEAAKGTGGAIVIDDSMPERAAAAYFWENDALVPDKKWVIALSDHTNGSDFAHEWEHKLDAFEKAAEYERSLIQNRIPNTRTSALGRALRRTGEQFERQYLTELNATGRQFELYVETKSFHPYFFATVFYRGVNERRVAIGRILIDPLNPRHYALYLKSRGMIYIPIAAGIAGVRAAAELAMNALGLPKRGANPAERETDNPPEAELPR